jgi:hypothetical protein
MICKNERRFQKYPLKNSLLLSLSLKKNRKLEKTAQKVVRMKNQKKKTVRKAQIIQNEIFY